MAAVQATANTGFQCYICGVRQPIYTRPFDSCCWVSIQCGTVCTRQLLPGLDTMWDCCSSYPMLQGAWDPSSAKQQVVFTITPAVCSDKKVHMVTAQHIDADKQGYMLCPRASSQQMRSMCHASVPIRCARTNSEHPYKQVNIQLLINNIETSIDSRTCCTVHRKHNVHLHQTSSTSAPITISMMPPCAAAR
jgi:hypothetical protein